MTAELATAEDRRDLAKIGVLWVSNPSIASPHVAAFKEGMRELGWIDGRTVHFVERYDNGDSSRLPRLAAELVALGVDVLFVADGAVPAARQATRKIPIVCPDFYDPILEGITKSMARPEGNITGVSWQSVESAAKRLQLTQELIPGLRRVGLLFDATDPGAVMEARGLLTTALHAGIDLKSVEVRGLGDFEAAFAKLKSAQLNALLVSVNPLTFRARDKIGGFASGIRLPLIAETGEFAEAGAVLTYGVDVLYTYRRGAYFVDRILKGAKASDLPIEQPTKFELVLNLSAAKALGLTIPQSITVSATKVIR
jgi:putative ABC transport system substrate-binding protein